MTSPKIIAIKNGQLDKMLKGVRSLVKEYVNTDVIEIETAAMFLSACERWKREHIEYVKKKDAKENKTIKEEEKIDEVKYWRKKMDKPIFAFNGEFGYEIIVWLPYLNYLAEQGEKFAVAHMPGREPFYYFVEEKYVIPGEAKDTMFGLHSKRQTKILNERYPDAITPKTFINDPSFRYRGSRMYNCDIHDKINDLGFYKTLEADKIYDAAESSLKASAKYDITTCEEARQILDVIDGETVVVNNKYTYEWLSRRKNYFTGGELLRLNNVLPDVLFNPFIDIHEDQSVSQEYRTEAMLDSSLFPKSLIDAYDALKYFNYTELAMNVLQIKAYQKASDKAVCVQGGDTYLAAILGKEIYLLRKKRSVIDYDELGRI